MNAWNLLTFYVFILLYWSLTNNKALLLLLHAPAALTLKGVSLISCGFTWIGQRAAEVSRHRLFDVSPLFLHLNIWEMVMKPSWGFERSLLGGRKQKTVAGLMKMHHLIGADAPAVTECVRRGRCCSTLSEKQLRLQKIFSCNLDWIIKQNRCAM